MGFCDRNPDMKTKLCKMTCGTCGKSYSYSRNVLKTQIYSDYFYKKVDALFVKLISKSIGKDITESTNIVYSQLNK